ncbi:MAG: RES family NAD+ phosphorylase [Acidobacteriia bacterium]|nr:RES family NAD+ phosphorylase [Terriglobia bacterium]
MLFSTATAFYYDEFAYNPHWGGHDHPEQLLLEPNEIVEHEPAPGFPRSDEGSEELLVSLFDIPYPDYDKGVGIYAGHDPEIGRMALNAIRDRRSPIYARIEERLQSENYFEVEKEFKRYLSKFGPALNATIPAGSLFYRARIGIAKTYTRCHEDNELETIHQPYLGDQIGAPPPLLATAGRLNRVGVSYLYLATDKLTAAAEVRPHPGHRLSIVGFFVKEGHPHRGLRRDRHRGFFEFRCAAQPVSPRPDDRP